MIRLHTVVEGQTEEEFVNSTMAPHLALRNIFMDARCVETSRSRGRIYRGGLLDYGRAKRDLLLWMKEDDHSNCYFTTMFDLYRLPADFPGFDDARKNNDPVRRVAALQESLKQDIDHHRLIPYVQLHEFEALVLADPSQLELEFISRTKEVAELGRVAKRFPSPELINDGDQSAPSKRIIELIPEYEGRKASAGPLIAGRIGLNTLRKRCCHFGSWLGQLEALAATSDTDQTGA